MLKNLFVFVILCGISQTAPVEKDSDVSALYYLTNTGWINKNENSNTSALLSADGLKKAIKDFQAFAGLDQTGELDEPTVKLMNTPRCGNPDIIGHGATTRKKRYALQGSKWRTNKLTYRITKYPQSGRLSKDKVDREIKKAFQLWEDQTALSFQEKKSGSVHIEIRFEKKEHGDGDPFDGPGGTLAHAFFPQFGGDAHFDDQEFWTINEFRGTNLLQTAAHEFGHSLGLSHSDVSDALMAPFYRGWVPNLSLHQDDIDAIQAIYNKNEEETISTSTRRPSFNDDDDDFDGNDDEDVDNDILCRDSEFDTIFSTEDGSYYVFKGSNYWKLTEESIAPGYPRKIRDDWEGLPNNIDAAVTWPDNKMTFFFKGSEYWKFENQKPKKGYPKPISRGFDGIPNNVDAAFIWGGNGKIYFFKGDDYWKFDPKKKPPVRPVYPRSLDNWDLPPKIKAAVRWSNKYTYFFTDNEYYRFNDRKFTIDSGDPGFPRKTGPWWFGCSKNLQSALHKENSIVSLFDYAGDEHLDVLAGDEK